MKREKKMITEINYDYLPLIKKFKDNFAIDIDEDLEYWVQLCLNYNPKAKRTKKKKYSN